MQITIEFSDPASLASQARALLAWLAPPKASVTQSPDQVVLRQAFDGLSKNALIVTRACLKTKEISSKALGPLVGGSADTLRGINASISTLAKKHGLTYADMFVRSYPRAGGTLYSLTPSFRSVVAAASATP